MKRRSGKWIALVVVIIFIAGGYGIYRTLTTGHIFQYHEKKQVLYTCPMHPQIIREEPGNCPICGMKLVPLQRKSPSTEHGDIPSGLAAITLDAERERLLGVTYGTVALRDMGRSIRTTARIVPDETRMYQVTSRVEGWIETLYVNQTGQLVAKGNPLYTIYSPELLAAAREYVSTLSAVEKSGELDDENMTASLEALRIAARERLLLMGMSARDVDMLEKNGTTGRTVTVNAPAGGYVLEKKVLEGQRVMMNEALMTVADMTVVWGLADILETDIPYVRKGQAVELSLPYWRGKVFRGRIVFISPSLDPDSRTLAVRINIPNPDLSLKKDMYADARIRYAAGRRASVPEGAVMNTGIRSYVFVSSGDSIIPREITTGLRDDGGFIEVVRGLRPGERVVTSANFLIDAESSLKSSLKGIEEIHGEKNR